MPQTDANDPPRVSGGDAIAAAPGGDVAVDPPPGAPSTDDPTVTHLPAQVASSAATQREHTPARALVPGYQIESVLGRGGMGVVYKALHLSLKRTVALKMIRAGAHAGPRERFRIEAEAVARLQHPNIVQIH